MEDIERLLSLIGALEDVSRKKDAEIERLTATQSQTLRTFDQCRILIGHYLVAYKNPATRNPATRALALFLQEVLHIDPGQAVGLKHRDLPESLEVLLELISRFMPKKDGQTDH